MIRVGGRARRRRVASVVGRCARGVVVVVEGWVASLVVGRCGPWRGVGLRVVVGSQSRWVRDAGCGLGAGLFVVGRRGAGARLGNRWCGSQLGVPLRPCHRDVGTLETGCAVRGADSVVCECVTISSGSAGVVA